MNGPLVVGIFLFNEIEVLDFAGPFEVFSLAEYPETKEKVFKVVTISEKDILLSARNGLKVKADYLFSNHPPLDVLIVPGGYGAEKIEIENPVALAWLRETAARTGIVASVCTGAFLLAKTGVISDQQVTTHWMDQADLQKTYPRLKVISGRKFIDAGNVLTSGGISAGIHLSFHLVSRLVGKDVAQATARRMEYDWSPTG